VKSARGGTSELSREVSPPAGDRWDKVIRELTPSDDLELKEVFTTAAPSGN